MGGKDQVVLYYRRACHLCEVVKESLSKLSRRAQFTSQLVDVASFPSDLMRTIPRIVVGDIGICHQPSQSHASGCHHNHAPAELSRTGSALSVAGFGRIPPDFEKPFPAGRDLYWTDDY